MKKSILIAHLFALLIYFNSYGQCLSGVYTIGGTSPDYPTFTSAVNSLTSNGVCGPIIFNVRDGIYNEQVILPEITGTSFTNTITFQSENGDSTGVKLVYASSSSSANFTLKFNGADFITLKKMTLSATGSTYARVIELTNFSTHNNFLNNAIIGTTTTGYSFDYALVYSETSVSSLDSNNVFISNYLLDGSYGLFLSGSTTTRLERGTIISDNTFINQSSTGIYLYYQDAPVLSENSISSNTTDAGANGINCYYCYNNLKIIKNKIYLPTMWSGNGIGINSSYTTSSNYGMIANNFVKVSANGRAVGIGVINSNYFKIYFNSVLVTKNSAGVAYYHKQANNIILMNNILSAESGYAIYLDYLSSGYTAPTSDYNDLYTNGENLCYWNGSYSKNLSSFSSYSHTDVHSISKKPDFVSLSDLHELNITRFHFGIPLPEIFDDIDGQTRSAFIDIGADEVVPPIIDAGLLTMNSSISCIGNHDLKVSLYNFGSDTLKNVRINWKVNNIIQPSFNWIGSLVDSVDVIFANYSFSRDSIYKIAVWVSLPNGQTDVNPWNDSLQTTIKTRMSGVYSIGGVSPDFPSFTAAVNELIKYGVCDTVTFNVRPGTYVEQISIPSITGAHMSYPITFQAENGDSSSVNLTYTSASSTANYTIKLTTTGYFVFKNLTLSATGSDYARVIELNQSVVEIHNSRIIGVPVTTQSDTFALIYSSGSSSFQYDGSGSYNIYNNNLFIDGSSALYFKTSPNNVTRGVNITNNVFQNQYYCGIYLYRQYGYLIENNLIISNSSFSERIGIYCEATNYYSHCDMLRIRRNRVIYTTPTGGGYGIRLNGCFGNKIGTDLFFNIISNNFITLNVAPGNRPAGIYVAGCEYLNVFNNTVHIIGNNPYSSAFSSAGNCFFIYCTNNLLSNSANGYAIIRGGATINNFNNYYSNGAYLGSINSSLLNNVSNLSDWITTVKMDQNSKSIKPEFISDTDLHENYVTRFNYGTALYEVPEDIDKESRNYLLPDIGADETAPADLDAGLESVLTGDYVCSGNNTIAVRFLNSGNDPLENLTIHFKINNVLQTPFSWSGRLYTGDTAIANIGTYNFTPGHANTISVWISQPNGLNDMNIVNDTLYKTIYSSLSGTYTIGGTSPDYTTFNSAIVDLKRYGVCGPVTFNVRPGTYSEQIVIPPITGASDVNIITFQSENGDSTSVNLTYSAFVDSLNFTVRILHLSDYILFKKITLSATGTKFARVIELQTYSVKVLNCRVLGVSGGNDVLNFILIYSMYNMGGLFDFNVLRNGSHGIYQANPNSSNPKITNNLFENQSNYGIYIESASLGLIEKNTLTSNSIDRAYGIFCRGSCTITKNKIIFPNSSGGYGIRYVFQSGNTPSTISNNFIVINAGFMDTYGLHCTANILYPNIAKIYNNSINVIGDNSNSTAYYQDNSNTNYSYLVKNNIFLNNARGYCIDNAQLQGISSDYNIFYTTGNYVARKKGGNVTDLAAWQISTSQDNHSKSMAPHFLSTVDLHENYVTNYNLGTPLAEVKEDIDGEVRSVLTPDIGADEFDYPLNLNNLENQSDMVIYPNPTAGWITIETPKVISTAIISIYNSNGQEVIRTQISDKIRIVNMSEFSNGIYLIVIRTDTNALMTKKIIKAHY